MPDSAPTPPRYVPPPPGALEAIELLVEGYQTALVAHAASMANTARLTGVVNAADVNLGIQGLWRLTAIRKTLRDLQNPHLVFPGNTPLPTDPGNATLPSGSSPAPTTAPVGAPGSAALRSGVLSFFEPVTPSSAAPGNATLPSGSSPAPTTAPVGALGNAPLPSGPSPAPTAAPIGAPGSAALRSGAFAPARPEQSPASSHLSHSFHTSHSSHTSHPSYVSHPTDPGDASDSTHSPLADLASPDNFLRWCRRPSADDLKDSLRAPNAAPLPIELAAETLFGCPVTDIPPLDQLGLPIADHTPSREIRRILSLTPLLAVCSHQSPLDSPSPTCSRPFSVFPVRRIPSVPCVPAARIHFLTPDPAIELPNTPAADASSPPTASRPIADSPPPPPSGSSSPAPVPDVHRHIPGRGG